MMRKWFIFDGGNSLTALYGQAKKTHVFIRVQTRTRTARTHRRDSKQHQFVVRGLCFLYYVFHLSKPRHASRVWRMCVSGSLACTHSSCTADGTHSEFEQFFFSALIIFPFRLWYSCVCVWFSIHFLLFPLTGHASVPKSTSTIGWNANVSTRMYLHCTRTANTVSRCRYTCAVFTYDLRNDFASSALVVLQCGALQTSKISNWLFVAASIDRYDRWIDWNCRLNSWSPHRHTVCWHKHYAAWW